MPFNDVANMIFLTLVLTLTLHDAFYATEIFGDAIHHSTNKVFHLNQLNTNAWYYYLDKDADTNVSYRCIQTIVYQQP